VKRHVFKIKPIFVEKIWGGDLVAKWYNSYDSQQVIGEIWSVCATETQKNVVENQNIALDDWIKQNPQWFPMKASELPFRVTIIDAKTDLSVQVHPTDETAHQFGLDSGLDEAWIILECQENGQIQCGHTAQTLSQFKEFVQTNQWNQLLTYQDISPGDVFYIPAGTIHAIGENTIIYEISQAVDCTFRLYDYQRVDPTSNKQRPLHLEQAYSVTQIPAVPVHKQIPEVLVDFEYKLTLLVDKKDYFTLHRIEVSNHAQVELPEWGFLTVVKGSGYIEGLKVDVGETVMVSVGLSRLDIEGNIEAIFASVRESE